jgi:hypothetical protein
MTDKETGPTAPAVPTPATNAARAEKIVRWAVWIGLAAVIVWIFADVVIKH